MNKKIVICEDDREIRELLVAFLSGQGYDCLPCENGLTALSCIKDNRDASLVILDLMLPFKSGDSVLADVRSFSDIPVIILSARDTVRTKVELIRLGADDYMTKPFDLDELYVRIEAVLRRTADKGSDGVMLTYKNLSLDKTKKEICVSGKVLSFAQKEYSIMELLMENRERLFSKSEIFEAVWKERYLDDDNLIKVHMSNIRSKLKAADPDNDYIETVWGMGYRLFR